MLPGETYSVKRNYNVQFNFCICGMDVPSAMQSFKISQSTLDFTLKPDTLKMYQSQTTPVTLMLTLEEPVGATLESIVMNQKSDAGFLDAMGDGEMDVTISADGRSALVEIDVRNPAKLQFGKSYTLYLDVCAAGSAVDGKQNSVKITVEVEK